MVSEIIFIFGCFQLISSVISGITQFWCAAFRLPRSCLREIDKLCSGFLWSGSDLNPRKAKISWEEVYLPKKEGGLGLRPLTKANKVYGIRLICKLFALNPSLWVNWVHKYLIQEGLFWTGTIGKGSWIWRKILKLCDCASSFIHWDVQNGSSVSFCMMIGLQWVD